MTDDPLTIARARTRANLFWRYLGVTVEDARAGWVRLRVPIRDDLRNAAGAPVHGAVFSALVDIAVGGALATMHTAAEGGVGQTTLDLNVSFLAPATEGDLFAEGRILRKGGTIAVGEASITDAAGRLLAIGRATYMLLKPRA
jgi:acyl-CoA thioesterase